MGIRRTSSPRPSDAPAVPFTYDDFVLTGTRVDARSIAVKVKASPAGAMRKPVARPFSAAEAARIRDSFVASTQRRTTGRMLMTTDTASELGRRLASVLLPPQVFRLLGESIAAVGRRQGGGLRIRLDLDDSLIDLPWEYLYRPDRSQSGISGFLLMDPALSMVRMAASRRIAIEPLAGQQGLHFIGAMWEGRLDAWNVWREFDELRTALKPVAKYLAPEFAVASDLDVFDRRIDAGNAILHYAGHCDFEPDGRAFLVREMNGSGDFGHTRKKHVADLAGTLKKSGTRLVVLTACNSGFWSVAGPLLKAGVPAVIGLNGGVASDSTIAFSTRLYQSLALGLSLDEAVGRARLAVMEWGARQGLFDWGLYMVYLQSPNAILLPRRGSTDIAARQARARRTHREAAARNLTHARELDGLNFGEIMSELSRRRVLILGRFSARRLPVLEAMKARLAQHRNRYIPELFTFTRPDSRDLVESILGFAALSRFIIADLSEPRSLPQELQAIVPNLQSVPIVPIINDGGREFATFDSLARRPNVVQPTLRYRTLADLEARLDRQIVEAAEKKRVEMAPRS